MTVELKQQKKVFETQKAVSRFLMRTRQKVEIH